MSYGYYGGEQVDFQWKKQLNDVLWRQCQEGSPFCDVTITVQGQVFKAHWCVLMTCPYFESLYSSGMVEKTSGKVNLDFSDVDTVKYVLEYIYTGKQSINSTVAESVLKLADYLQLENLKKKCGDYLRLHEVTVENCLHLCTLGSMYNLDELYKKSQNVLYASFHEVVLLDGILSVPFDVLLGFVDDNNLNYFSAVKFFYLILRWVNHDLESRKVHFDALFSALKLETVGLTDMDKIKEEQLVKDSEVCLNLIKSYDSSVNKGEINPDNCLKDVIVFCGIRKSSKHFAYLLKEKRWARLPFMEQRHGHYCKRIYASAVVDDELYILREEESFKASSRLLKLNKKEGCWEKTSIPSVTDAFASCSIARHNLVLSCHGYICMLAARNGPSWADLPNTVHLRLFPTRANQAYKYVEVDSLRSDQFDLVELNACTVQDNIVCILAEIVTNGRTRKQSAKCICYNVTTGSFTDCSKGAKFGRFMYSDDSGKVYVHTHVGAKHSLVFDHTTQKWRTARFSLPVLKNMYVRPLAMSVVYNKDIYAFGAQDYMHSGNIPQQPNLFSYKTRNWEQLPEAPMRLSDDAVPVVMKVPASLVTCPPKCPHCVKREPYISASDDDNVGDSERYSDEEEYDEYYNDSDSVYGYDSDSNGPGDCCIQ